MAEPFILIVDDEEEVCQLLTSFLEDLGGERAAAHTVDEAVSLLDSVTPDLIITDLRMPGGSGFDVLRAARARDVDIVVIIMTGYGSMETAIEAMRLGAFDYVTKPFNLDEVRLTVERGLEARNLRLTNRQLTAMIGVEAGGTSPLEEILGILARGIQDHGGVKIGHSERVRNHLASLAMELGLDDTERRRWELAALLCEIGEVMIPVRLWLKKGPLTPEEWFLVRKHPEKSESILQTARMDPLITKAVRHHHERWDGSGYPDRLAGENIPLLSRALAIAGAFDAMTSPRPYRQAVLSETAAIELKRCARSAFDPELVDIFVDRIIRGMSSLDATGIGGGFSIQENPR